MESPRAIILIEADDKGGFRVNPEALEVLSSIKKPVSVVSVVGKYRTGKSFLLNRILLNRTSGFGVGPTIMACTKGIWMWSEPIPMETSDGEECALILLDTEGLGALDENANHDTRIFLLGVLLASNFVYNSVGSLDEAALSNLSLIVNLTKQLQVKSSVGPPDMDEMSAYFPSLLWVLRDFALQLIDRSGNEISPKDYLENALMPQKGVSDNVEQKNRIRRYIKHFFKERDCFPLVRPSESEEVLQALDTAAESVLRPEFVTQMVQLRKFVLRKAKIKMLNGKKMNGDMLGSLATAYVNSINSGSVPNIDTAWNYMCKSECEKLTQVSVGELEVKMTGFQFPEPSSKLKEIYQTARDELIMKFRQQAVGPQIPAYEADLKAKMREVYMRVKETNEKAVGQACEKSFAGFYKEMIDKLKEGEYTQLVNVKRDLETYTSEFRKGPLKGVTAEKKLSEFSQKLIAEAADYIHRNSSQESQNQQRRLTQSLELAQSQLSQKREEWTREMDELKNRLEQTEKNGHGAKAQVMTLTMQLEELQRERQRVEERHKERIEDLKKDYVDRNADVKLRLDDANKQLAEIQGKHAKESAALEREKALLEQELKFRKEECEDLKAKRAQLEADNKALRSDLRALRESKSQATGEGSIDVESLQQEIADLREQLETATAMTAQLDLPQSENELQEELIALRAEVTRLRQSGRVSAPTDSLKPREQTPQKAGSAQKPPLASPQVRTQSPQVSTQSAQRSLTQSPQVVTQTIVDEEEIQNLREELTRTKKQLKDTVDQKNAAVRRMQAEQTQSKTQAKAESPAAAIGESRELLQKAVGVVCRFCSQVVILQFFAAHQEECEREYQARLRANPELTLVSVPQATIDHRGEKFVISCKRQERVWVVNRTLEALKKLQSALDAASPSSDFPAFAEVLRTAGDSMNSKARGMPLAEKQKEVEKYLSTVANGEFGMTQEVRQFLG